MDYCRGSVNEWREMSRQMFKKLRMDLSFSSQGCLMVFFYLVLKPLGYLSLMK